MIKNEIDQEIEDFIALTETEKEKIYKKIRYFYVSFFLLAAIIVCASVVNVIVAKKIKSQHQISQIGFCDEGFLPEDVQFEVTEKMIEYQVINFIELLRTIPDNFTDMQNSFSTARLYSRGEAQDQVVKNFYDWNIQEKIKEDFVSYVTINDIKKNINNEYEIHWKESVWQGGKFKFDVDYYGYFLYEILPPVYEEDLFANPSGIYITKYSLTKVSE